MAGRTSAASLVKRSEALALTPLLMIATLGIGWLVWSVLEWRHGRTPSYRLLGLRVVRRSGDAPCACGEIRRLRRRHLPPLGAADRRRLLRSSDSASCSAPRRRTAFSTIRAPAPWDWLTATRVTDEGPGRRSMATSARSSSRSRACSHAPPGRRGRATTGAPEPVTAAAVRIRVAGPCWEVGPAWRPAAVWHRCRWHRRGSRDAAWTAASRRRP